EVVEESLNIRFHHEVVLTELKLHGQLIHRVQSAPVRPVPIATTQKILLVDGFQYPRDRQLQQLVLHHRNPQRTLSSIRLRYPVTADQSCPVAFPLQPLYEIPDVRSEEHTSELQ